MNNLSIKDHRMINYEDYLKARWDYIESLDCLRETKEQWKGWYNLTLREAFEVWKRVYGE